MRSILYRLAFVCARWLFLQYSILPQGVIGSPCGLQTNKRHREHLNQRCPIQAYESSGLNDGGKGRWGGVLKGVCKAQWGLRVLPSKESPSPGFQTPVVEPTPMKNWGFEFLISVFPPLESPLLFPCVCANKRLVFVVLGMAAFGSSTYRSATTSALPSGWSCIGGIEHGKHEWCHTVAMNLRNRPRH